MPFNINTFKQQGLFYGGARPANFNVTLSVPNGIGIDNTTVQKFTFVCRASEIPPSQIPSIDVPYFGRKIKVSGDRVYPDWNITVMNDEDFSVRAMFELWMNGINGAEANVRDPALVDELYKTDSSIQQFSKDGEIIREYTMYGAFPTLVGPMATDWDSTNQIQTFPVTFAYDYWLPTVEQSSKNIGGVNVYGPAAVTDGPLGP